MLVIGSSTGGPQALMTLVTELGPVIDRCPVLITQHMPPTFTTILAEHLARSSRRPAHEGIDGEPVKPGRSISRPADATCASCAAARRPRSRSMTARP